MNRVLVALDRHLAIQLEHFVSQQVLPFELPKGELAEAARLYERSVEVRENDSELDNIAVAESLEQLGSAYAALGDHAAAEDVYARALAIREQLLVHSNPEQDPVILQIVLPTRSREAAESFAPVELPLYAAER